MRRRWLLGLVLGAAVLLLAGRVVAGWVVDFRWYESLGATRLFWAKATNLALLRGVAFTVGTALVFVNLYAVRHSVQSVSLPRRVGNIEIGEEVSGRYLLGAVLVLSVAIGLLLAFSWGDWTSLELIRHGETFRESDPYFQLDLAFWVYWLPVESALHIWALIAVLGVTVLVMFLYALTPSLRWEQGRLVITNYVRRHLFVLGGLFLLLLAWSYRLDAYGLLLDGSGDNGTFVALDHRVGIPANLVLALATIVGAMLLVWSGWIGQLRLAFVTLASVLVLSLGLRQLVPPIAARFLTPADAEARDRPYASIRAGFTRRAFDVDRIAAPDSVRRVGPISDIAGPTPLWDPEAIQRSVAFMRLSGRALGSLGWELRDHRLQALVVEQPIGPDAADLLAAWYVSRLDAGLTGENGVLMRPGVTADGVQRVPAAMVADSLTGYAVVFDSIGNIAAPVLRSQGDRLAHAWGLQNPRLLRHRDGAQDPKVVQYRGVRERVQRLFPFFMQGNRVLPMLLGDSLTWAVHLYSASATYPLADPIALTGADVRYARHAAVALVNAHTGRVVAVGDPEPDPVAVTWMRRFPRLFVPVSAVREEVLRQIPPPGDGAMTQARVLARFGRRGEAGPPSHLARVTGGDTLFAFPAYTPFVDSARQRIAVAWPVVDAAERLRGAVVASGGADVSLRWLPVDSIGPRWQGVIELLRRGLDSAASAGRGDPVTLARGPARVVAAGDRLAVVQTAYLWRSESAPAVRFAAAMYGADSVRIGRTVMNALGVPEPAVNTIPLTPEAFRARVTQLYAQMREALARGDLSGFGVAYDALGRLLRASQTAP
ncbi:MAG: UPF0182 family protein [Gemmatimonadaceae bacterium]|nr:UPF0182 family protein [Gemmatimonadaceae bacterium]